MITKWFTAKRMSALRPGIEAMAERLIDDMVKLGHPADLKASLGFPLPVWVICDMLGVPDSDRDTFSYWSDTLLNLTRYTEAEIEAAQAEFVQYMAAHIAAKRARPGDDLLSELITATDTEGDRWSDATLVATVRDWVACLSRPVAEHLAALGNPTWFARFAAQVMTDPAFRNIMIDETLSAPSMHQILDGLNRCLPDFPAEVRAERGDMARQLMVHMYAERERALAEGTPTPRSSWDDAASGLIDALVGLWLAPITPRP